MASAREIRAGGAFVEITAKDDDLKKKLRSTENAMKDLKKKFGEESTFGNVFKILKGAGAVAGISLAAQQLSAVATHAATMKQALADGSKSAGDVAEELLKSLPVLGNIRTAGLAIRDIFTGEATAIRQLTEHTDRLNASMDAFKRTTAAAGEAHQQMLTVLRGVEREGAMIGKSGPFAEWATSLQGFADKLERIKQQTGSAFAKVADAAKVPVKDNDGKTIQVPATEAKRRLESDQMKFNPERSVGELAALRAERDKLDQEINRTRGMSGSGAGERLSEIDAIIKKENERKEQYIRIGMEISRVNDIIRASEQGIADVKVTASIAAWQSLLNVFGQGKAITAEWFDKLMKDTDEWNAKMASVESQLEDFFSGVEGQTIMGGVESALEGVFGEIEKKFEDAGKRITESVMTPAEQLQAKLAELQILFDATAISQETFDRARKAAADGIDVANRVSTRGTFNPRAIQSLQGGGSTVDRIAKASEQTAKNTAKLDRLRGGIFV